MWLITDLFTFIYNRYIALKRKYLKLKKETTVYMGKWDNETPTQSNKPSAHSSLTKSEARAKLQKGFPRGSKWRYFNVANTNSMEPFIDANSIVLCEKVYSGTLNKQPLTVGDICIYKRERDGLLIIHRIEQVKLEKGLYKFKGDNNFRSDGWIKVENILWRYVGQIQTRQIETGD